MLTHTGEACTSRKPKPAPGSTRTCVNVNVA